MGWKAQMTYIGYLSLLVYRTLRTRHGSCWVHRPSGGSDAQVPSWLMTLLPVTVSHPIVVCVRFRRFCPMPAKGWSHTLAQKYLCHATCIKLFLQNYFVGYSFLSSHLVTVTIYCSFSPFYAGEICFWPCTLFVKRNQPVLQLFFCTFTWKTRKLGKGCPVIKPTCYVWSLVNVWV